MHHTRISLLLLCACAAVAVLTATAPAAEFLDVPTSHWAWGYIQAVSLAGVVQGYDSTSYRPDVVVTRDQMAAYIARAIAGGDDQVTPGPAIPSFSDVEGGWAYDYIEYCHAPEQDVVQGFPDGTYRPGDAVDRGTMAIYIARFMAGGESAIPTAPMDATFTDVPIGHPSFKYVEYCADPSRKVVQGYGNGIYAPAVLVTRDQMAVFVCRALGLATPTPAALTYNVTDYFPLSGGRSWMYRANGNPTPSFVSAAIAPAADFSGQSFTGIVEYPQGLVNYWTSSLSGLLLGGIYHPSVGANASVTPAFSIPNGLSAGSQDTQTADLYVGSVKQQGQASFGYTFVGVEGVTVPAGVFTDCVKLEIQLSTPLGSSWADFWYAKGIGLVKMDSRPFGGSTWWELAGCAIPAANPAAGPRNVTDYYPLGQGDTWTDLTSRGELTISISGTTNILGQIYANRADSTNYIDYWRAGSDGLYFGGMLDEDLVVFSPAPLIPNGLSPGQSVSRAATVYVGGLPAGQGSISFTFVGAYDVMVPAGVFADCMKVEILMVPPAGLQDATPKRVYMWWASGVGEVALDTIPFGRENAAVLESATVGGVSYP